MIYCTYLTTYNGNKLPPFYIGFSTVDRIGQGYRGSVSSPKYIDMWRQELKEHPEFFKTQILTIHNTIKEANHKEISFQKQLDVVRNPLYINQAVFPHINGNGMTGKHHTLEAREKIGAAFRGKIRGPNPKISQAKKGIKFTDEHKHKLRLAKIGKTLTEEHKRKISVTTSQSKMGHKHSEEAKNNMRIAANKRWLLQKQKHCEKQGEINGQSPPIREQQGLN